jgi:hypothetical protein
MDKKCSQIDFKKSGPSIEKVDDPPIQIPSVSKPVGEFSFRHIDLFECFAAFENIISSYLLSRVGCFQSCNHFFCFSFRVERLLLFLTATSLVFFLHDQVLNYVNNRNLIQVAPK